MSRSQHPRMGTGLPDDPSPALAEHHAPPTTPARTAARLALSAVLIFAGLSHLFWARQTFQAQVPRSIPLDAAVW